MMEDEVKQVINQVGGLTEFKRQREKEWNDLDENLGKILEKVYEEIQDPYLRMQMKEYFSQDLFLLNQVKRFIDMNLIDEAKSTEETYGEILFKVLNKYLEFKKASK